MSCVKRLGLAQARWDAPSRRMHPIVGAGVVAAAAAIVACGATAGGGTQVSKTTASPTQSPAAPGIHVDTSMVTPFPLPAGDQAVWVTTGADGNLWLTTHSSGVDRVTTSGAVTRYTPLGVPIQIIAAADGNIWFASTDNKGIGRISPAGSVSWFDAGYNAFWITAGPVGSIWWYDNDETGHVGEVTSTGSVTHFNVGCSEAITEGPDGNIWCTSAGAIYRITTSGVSTQFSTPDTITDIPSITPGPDGNIWFTELEASKVGKITPSGQITEYAIPPPNKRPGFITTGPDGNLWFASGVSGLYSQTGNAFGMITPTGMVTVFDVQPRPSVLTIGPDHHLWFIASGGSELRVFGS